MCRCRLFTNCGKLDALAAHSSDHTKTTRDKCTYAVVAQPRTHTNSGCGCVRERDIEIQIQNHHHRSRHRKDEEKKEVLADGCNTYLCVETRNKTTSLSQPLFTTQNHRPTRSTSGGCGSKNTCLQNSRNRMLVAYAHWRKKASCRCRRPRRCGCRKNKRLRC